MPHRNDVSNEIQRFACLISPGIPRPRIEVAVDNSWTDATYDEEKPGDFPYECRGVYTISDSKEELLYVGVALKNFASRVWMHDDILGPRRRWTDIIRFESRHLPLALALEFWLIARLKLEFNVQYKDYELPGDV